MRDRVPWIGDDEQRLMSKHTQLWLSPDAVGGEEDVGGSMGKGGVQVNGDGMAVVEI